MINNLKAAKRETKTKGELNSLRAKGFIPAIVYGGKNPNLKLSIEEKFIKDVLKSKNFLSDPITTTLYSPPASWGEAFEIDNAKGVKEVLNLLVAHLNGDDIPDIFDESYQVFLSDLWQKILREADLVNEREMPKPRTINPNNLLYK